MNDLAIIRCYIAYAREDAKRIQALAEARMPSALQPGTRELPMLVSAYLAAATILKNAADVLAEQIEREEQEKP